MNSIDDRIYSTLRHELGNSVNSLTITLEVLLKNYEFFNDETKIEFISKSLEQVNRQYKILECLRIYQSADIGEMTRIELSQFFDVWVSDLQDKISDETIKFQHQCDSLQSFILADREALVHSLNSIAENAIDALAGQEQPELMVSCCVTGKNVEILIADNGEGMNSETVNRAEVPLFTTRENRMGLGLSVAMKLISKMGGLLEIASEKSKGTSAKICFPISG